MARPQDRDPRRIPFEPRVKVWLELEGEYAFGYGMSNILKAVAQTGSIKAAADLLGKSYRHIWSRIKAAERTLGQPLVETQVGGSGLQRSTLTELAEDLVENYDALRGRMLDVVRTDFSDRFQARH